jgi:hypothetical protein
MSMNHWIFGLCSLSLGLGAVLYNVDIRLPGDNQGYAPVQPIAFSHRVHAGELNIDCQYCHFGARQSRHAGVPPASVCMNCHQTVTASSDTLLKEKVAAQASGRDPKLIVSPELRKLYDALGLDEGLNPSPDGQTTPIEWVRVHNLADFVYFDHRVHVARDVACETCHGPVQGMDRLRQESDLSMGWCIECHRSQSFSAHEALSGSTDRIENHVSTNCVSCHL